MCYNFKSRPSLWTGGMGILPIFSKSHNGISTCREDNEGHP